MVWTGKIFPDLLHFQLQKNIFCKRRPGTRSRSVHKAAEPRGCDSVTVFECLPGLTLRNSHIRHSGFLVPVTQRQAGYVMRHGAVTMTQSWLQHTVAARSQRRSPNSDIKGEPCWTGPRPAEASVYSKLQPPSLAKQRFWGQRGSAADCQTAVQAPLASMSLGIRVTSLKFSVHYSGLSCSFVSAQSRTTPFNHSVTISWLHKPKLVVKEILNKQKKTTIIKRNA